MVNLLEFEGKRLFKKYGIPIPSGYLINSVSDAKNIDKNYVLKAQVPAGHRGKTGGVIKVSNKNDVEKAIKKISNLDFNGFKANQFLLEEMINHKKELYLSITLDRSNKTPVLIASEFGGVEIESLQKNKILSLKIDIFLGLVDYIKRSAFSFLKLEEKYMGDFYSILDSMWSLFTKEDAELVEINPLAVTDSNLIALDSKVVIEDDALFRHEEYKKDVFSSDPLEMEAKKKGISFVRLGGNIGLIANGAGLTLATIDQIKLAGGNAGDFLDLGGTDDPAKVEEAIGLVAKSNPKVLLINIFGGVTKADTVAEGIVSAIKKLNMKFNIVVRLRGFNEETGKNLLKQNGIEAFTDMKQAISRAVELSE